MEYVTDLNEIYEKLTYERYPKFKQFYYDKDNSKYVPTIRADFDLLNFSNILHISVDDDGLYQVHFVNNTLIGKFIK
jgi:hypothetical protein